MNYDIRYIDQKEKGQKLETWKVGLGGGGGGGGG